MDKFPLMNTAREMKLKWLYEPAFLPVAAVHDGEMSLVIS
jgi:hypothetical protein